MKKDIITTEEIGEILEKYNIGRKPLAKLLGWGDTAIIRYMSGITPTTEYSDKLRRVLDEPGFFYNILLEGKERISDVAFTKSLRKVKELVYGNKLDAAARYVYARVDGDISVSRLQAILYYAQGFHIALYNKEIFEDEYRLAPHGFRPYPGIEEKLKLEAGDVAEVCEGFLNDSEKEMLNIIQNVLGWFGPEAIKLLTSSERAYLARGLGRGDNRVVTNEKLGRLFKNILDHYNISKPAKLYTYFNKRIVEIRRMRRKV